nr:hypothetical protein [Tanacetum cinerariifolium]
MGLVLGRRGMWWSWGRRGGRPWGGSYRGIGLSWLLVCRWQRGWRGRWWAQLSLFGICEHGGEIVYGVGLVCHGGGLCGDVSEEGYGQLDEGFDIGGGGSVFESGVFFWRHGNENESTK